MRLALLCVAGFLLAALLGLGVFWWFRRRPGSGQPTQTQANALVAISEGTGPGGFAYHYSNAQLDAVLKSYGLSRALMDRWATGWDKRSAT